MSTATPSQLRDWTIYKITNPSGYIYIGKTFNLSNRIRQYKNRSHKNQPIIFRSIVKYGWDAHKFEIIDSFKSTTSYASDKEMYWIRSFMSNKSKYPEQKGMNMTDGGEGTIGKPTSEYQKQRAREVHKGNQWNKGRVHTEEEKRKRVVGRIGKKDSEEVRAKKHQNNIKLRGKMVVAYSSNGELLGEYRSQNECAAQFGLSRNTMSSILMGRVKTKPLIKNRGFIFKFK
jgi:group I intron endonuclease